MSDVKLGQLIDANAQRDAIHVAIAPVAAAETLMAGQHIGLTDDGRATRSTQHIGIVDPFLTTEVGEGRGFYLFLYPNTVTGMRHEWTHPAFGAEDSNKAVSEKWLKDLAESVGMSYGRLMDGAKDWLDSAGSTWRERLIGGEEMEGVSTPEAFWDHYEIVTGTKVAENDRQSFFSCSC